MNRDEILKAVSQAEPVAENERYVARNALRQAAIVAVVVCMIMVILEWFVFKKFDFGKPFLIAVTESLANVLESHKSGNKKMKVIGILGLVFSAFLLVLYIGGLFR